MNIKEAQRIIEQQRRAFRRLDNKRFVENGTEYRIRYEGGLAEFFSIECRKVGSRNFKYLTGFGAYKMKNGDEVMAHIVNTIRHIENVDPCMIV